MSCRRVFSGSFIADGVPEYTDFPSGCQKGGSYKRARNKSNCKKMNKKHPVVMKKKKPGKKKPTKKPKQTKKQSMKKKTKRNVSKTKKVELIIESICKSMKSKCTPKYKKILRKLVVKNM
tara:strand:+ start:345 stop:704 length:360 start_codon:yes stop_codon:yes gene_type:complete